MKNDKMKCFDRVDQSSGGLILNITQIPLKQWTLVPTTLEKGFLGMIEIDGCTSLGTCLQWRTVLGSLYGQGSTGMVI